MKTEKIKYPFSWEERRPVLKEQVFFVPNYYEEHLGSIFPSWSHEDLFGNDRPVYIEYCSGNGEWIIKKAQENPNSNWVAVEKKFERVRKIHSKKRTMGVNNLVIIAGEALTFTKEYLQESSADSIFINFPDPWPKQRHAKYRLLQETFISHLKRITREKGKINIVTDSEPYVNQIITEFAKVDGLMKSICSEADSYGTSYFDRLWRSKGLAIHYLEYFKQEG